MTRLNCIAWLLLSICAAAAAPVSGQTKVKTSVEKVTLFIDGAQVTRTKQVDIPAGNSTLVFTGLSPYLDDKSMQVAAKGRFTVTAVNGSSTTRTASNARPASKRWSRSLPTSGNNKRNSRPHAK